VNHSEDFLEGFFTKCAEAGLTEEQSIEFFKQANPWLRKLLSGMQSTIPAMGRGFGNAVTGVRNFAAQHPLATGLMSGASATGAGQSIWESLRNKNPRSPTDTNPFAGVPAQSGSLKSVLDQVNPSSAYK
jgi:hypothetical protein